jgi:hypothetical protein
VLIFISQLSKPKVTLLTLIETGGAAFPAEVQVLSPHLNMSSTKPSKRKSEVTPNYLSPFISKFVF